MKKLILFFCLLWAADCCDAQGTWHNLGAGVNCDSIFGNCFPSVTAICADTINNILYVGGNFNKAGNFKQISISKWDEVNWDSLAEPIPDVTAMMMYKGSLYVGIANVGFIVKYDGTNWINLPMVNGEVYCFTIYKDTLYAGGAFTTNDSGVLLNNIAKWDGIDWWPVGGGIGDDNFPGMVNALEVFKGNLYAGGKFDSAGSKLIRGIAEWNGAQWDTLNSTISSDVYSLKAFDNYLFIGGDGAWFGENMAKYDGTNITSVDSGANNLVYSLTSWNGSLYVGGEFDSAGKIIETNHIARWLPDTALGISQVTVDREQLTISPNPFSEHTTLQFSQPTTTNSQFSLYDLTGRKVEDYFILAGSKSFTLKRKNLQAGMYFYKVSGSGMRVITGKVVIE